MLDKGSEKCMNCNNKSGFPRGLCWECERPLCKKCRCVMSILTGKTKLREDLAIICNNCSKKYER